MNNAAINILIIGKDATASALARKLSEYDEVGKIYIAPGNGFDNSEIWENIDIREDDITELLKFALENNIDLTIPVSEASFKTDIVSFFQSNNQNIFGPAKESCAAFLNKITCKKFLYKIKAQNPKFVMASKYPQALTYLEKFTYPVIISTAEISDSQDSIMVCTTFKIAQNFLDKLFLNGETDVLIQEYPYGNSFTSYYITDGYSAVPLATTKNYKLEGQDCGRYTTGTGCFVPEYRITETTSQRLQNIAQNILGYMDYKGHPYTGILGIEGVLAKNDKFYIMDVKPFLQKHDARAVLDICDDNLIKIIYSCINGFFSDEYNEIKTSHCSSVSVCVNFDNEKTDITKIVENPDIDFINIKKLDNEYFSVKGACFTLTKTAGTLTMAKSKLYSEISEIDLRGMKYREDICAEVNI